MFEIKPDFSNSCSLDELLGHHGDGRAALASGDNEAALIKAHREKDLATFGAALIMCGAVERGLVKLSALETIDDEIKLYLAYAYWYKDQPEAALGLLSEITSGLNEAKALRLGAFIRRETLQVLFLCNRNTAPEIAQANSGNISFRVAVVDDTGGTMRMGEIIPDRFGPDLIISYNVVGKELPGDVFDLDIPNCFRTGDVDMGLTAQYASLRRADLVICNSTHEHRDLQEIYGPRIASFPAFSLYRDTASFELPDATKKYDISLSGNSFVPHMQQKGKLAFRLATLDDPDLNIIIQDGYLKSRAYKELIGQSRFVPMGVRYTGLLQTRALDAVRFGALNLHPEDVPFDLLFETAGVGFHAFSEPSFEDDIRTHLSNHDRYRSGFDADLTAVKEEFKQVFLPSPAKEIRLAKFSMFQHSLRNPMENRTEPHTQLNAGLGDMVNLTGAGFEAFCASPVDSNDKDLARQNFEQSVSRFPRSLILAFNRACFLWICGEREGAVGEFQRVLDLCQEGDFDPTSQSLLPHRVPDLQEFMPYQLYANSVIDDLRGRDGSMDKSRGVIQATARTYLGLRELQAERLEEGLAYLREAMDLCPAHFPAARLLTKALYVTQVGAEEIAKSFYLTINLYPLYLGELMPLGADAERRLGRDDKALEIIKIWALFMIRVNWLDPAKNRVPDQTWAELNAHLHELPLYVQAGLREKFKEVP